MALNKDARLHLRAERLLGTRSVRNGSAFIVYLSLSIYFFGIPVLFHPTQFYVGMGTDPDIFLWCLVWWPHALANHLNPFISPTGANLAWTTSMPGPSLLAYPITCSLGPVVAYNFLCLLAPTSAGWAAFCLCHYITKRFWPALLGGYLFGFSTYILGHMLGHLFLVIVFPIPIIVLLVLLQLNRAISRRLATIGLTLMLTFEFLTSTEIFATTSIVGAFMIALALLIFPVDRKRAVWSSLSPLVYAYAATALLLTPCLYYIFARGERPPINPPPMYSADLLNFLLPTEVTLIGHNQFAAVTAHFTGNLAENTSYFGIPFLATFLLFTGSYWCKPSARLLILSILFVSGASLGPTLHIAGQPTITLPWTVASHLPLIDQALPVRLSLYSFLIAGVITAIYLSDRARRRTTRLIVGGLIVLFLWPNVSYFRSFGISEVETPAFFSTGTYQHYLKRDETVLVLPWGDLGNSRLWQAQTNMYFRIAGSSERLLAFLGSHKMSAIIVDQRHQGDWPKVLSSRGVAPPTDIGGVLLYRVPSSMPATR